MDQDKIRDVVLKELSRTDGLLEMKPCWVTRDFLPPGKRLGLPDEQYDAGPRGAICERWIVSETHAENTIPVPNEGLSFLKLPGGEDVRLVDALATCRAGLLGEEYAKRHAGLDRLLKIYDFRQRLFYHIHQRAQDAKLVGMNPKEEAYYYLDADLGDHPETFFGVHPYIVREHLQEELFVPYLQRWEGDEILKYSLGYLNVVGEGFHTPPGILHAPGSALTLELQESSDIMAVLQAEIDGVKISKRMLDRHIPADLVRAKGEAAVLDQIDWETCADTNYFENHHLSPQRVAGELPKGAMEEWIWYNSKCFSGTRITLQPGARYLSRGLGAHGLLVWRGKGTVGNVPVEGQAVSLADSHDEFLVTHARAQRGVEIANSGSVPMVIFKFFGPEINDAIAPRIRPVH